MELYYLWPTSISHVILDNVKGVPLECLIYKEGIVSNPASTVWWCIPENKLVPLAIDTAANVLVLVPKEKLVASNNLK